MRFSLLFMTFKAVGRLGVVSPRSRISSLSPIPPPPQPPRFCVKMLDQTYLRGLAFVFFFFTDPGTFSYSFSQTSVIWFFGLSRLEGRFSPFPGVRSSFPFSVFEKFV